LDFLSVSLQVFASDADEGDNGLVLYEINRRQSDPSQYFVMDLRSGVITLNRPLDYELKRVHELVVQARDNASHPEVRCLIPIVGLAELGAA
jgi:protocadherin-16/23